MVGIIKQQLEKVQYADLSNFNADSNTYVIKKRVDIKVEVDNCYLIRVKPSAYNNQVIVTNWNGGNMPNHEYLKVDISKVMAKMIRVVGVAHNYQTHEDLAAFWSGWLSTDDIEVIAKL